ncbi:MAG: hypothetical protein OEV42_07845 [Deltaproteobacteria bacterium]|nr:hypothetical protein [Deltaproteobacteria bacterium]
MGDYSRDPKARLADSVAKHYVGVRMQQGVPILDADWNTMDDIRRYELEISNSAVIGNGAPVGSIGFWIVPLDNGGVNTIVIRADIMDAYGLSSVIVDLATSTAATILGFNEQNFSVTRSGSSPARLTGMRSEPFPLSDGDSLEISINGAPPVSITFAGGDFADISIATAAEVSAVINTALVTATASPGAGNDFIIKGANDKGDTGKLLIEGKMVVNDSDIMYSEQPLYDNSQLAAEWDVDPVAPLTTPGSSDAYLIFLDIWDREIDSKEDENLVDVHIGIETTIRLRREWVVRVVLEDDYFALFNARPAGHTYYPLALVQRSTGVDAIDGESITDLRETEVSFLREVAFRDHDNTMLVDTDKFYVLLSNTRDTVRDFIFHLTTKFIAPDSEYLAAEVMGIDALSAIAVVAEQGVALMNANSLSTKGALSLFEQLRMAEERFVQRWQESVLPLNKPGEGTIYLSAFTTMIDRIGGLVSGPAPGSFTSLSDALARGNLYEAVRTQQRIIYEFGQELDRSTGFIQIIYLGSLTPTVMRNGNFDLRYRVSGNVTPEDVIDVEVFIDPQWSTELRNLDSSIPLDIRMGPGEDEVEFLVSVTAPDVDAATTTFSLRAYARSNEVGLGRNSTQKILTIGDNVPPSEEGFVIFPLTSNLVSIDGVYQFPPAVAGGAASFSIRFANNTMTPVEVNVSYTPAPSGWTIFAPAPSSLSNVTIPAENNIEFGFDFIRPAGNGITFDFTLTATESGTSNILGEAVISIITVE